MQFVYREFLKTDCRNMLICFKPKNFKKSAKYENYLNSYFTCKVKLYKHLF